VLADGLLPREPQTRKVSREKNFPHILLLSGMTQRLEEGDCYVAEDKKHIIDCMANDSPGGESFQVRLQASLARANSAIQAHFALAAWPFAVQEGVVENFDLANPGTMSLPKVLRRDVSREQLTFSLAQVTQVTNKHIMAVGRGLPPNLLVLDLSFQGCRQITGHGIKDFAENLPQTIRKLRLNFLGCSGASDAAVHDLACRFPPNMKELMLDFGMCPQISISSIKSLAFGLPKGITSFVGRFKGTQVDRNYESLKELQYAARNHESLQEFRQVATKLAVLGRAGGWK
jgi:hypothetical protein